MWTYSKIVIYVNVLANLNCSDAGSTDFIEKG